MSINTVGYEAETKKHTTTSIVLETSLFQNGELQELEIPCNTSESTEYIKTHNLNDSFAQQRCPFGQPLETNATIQLNSQRF